MTGYAISADRQELFLAVGDYRQAEHVETLDSADLDRCFRRAERFFTLSLQEEFINQLEETSPAFEAAYAVYSNRGYLSRIRFVLLSNARLATRRKSVDTREVDGRYLTYNVLDLQRYADILTSSGGNEPLEIDVLEFNGREPIPCLRAYSGGDGYESYLVVLPASLLSEIYGRSVPGCWSRMYGLFFRPEPKSTEELYRQFRMSLKCFSPTTTALRLRHQKSRPVG